MLTILITLLNSLPFSACERLELPVQHLEVCWVMKDRAPEDRPRAVAELLTQQKLRAARFEPFETLTNLREPSAESQTVDAVYTWIQSHPEMTKNLDRLILTDRANFSEGTYRRRVHSQVTETIAIVNVTQLLSDPPSAVPQHLQKIEKAFSLSNEVTQSIVKPAPQLNGASIASCVDEHLKTRGSLVKFEKSTFAAEFLAVTDTESARDSSDEYTELNDVVSACSAPFWKNSHSGSRESLAPSESGESDSAEIAIQELTRAADLCQKHGYPAEMLSRNLQNLKQMVTKYGQDDGIDLRPSGGYRIDASKPQSQWSKVVLVRSSSFEDIVYGDDVLPVKSLNAQEDFYWFLQLDLTAHALQATQGAGGNAAQILFGPTFSQIPSENLTPEVWVTTCAELFVPSQGEVMQMLANSPQQSKKMREPLSEILNWVSHRFVYHEGQGD